MRDDYLERFKDFTIGIPGFRSEILEDDKEWWALGRHHGLITPLLDWTYSPYIASFFAFTEYIELMNPGFKNGTQKQGITFGTEPVVVWALVISDGLEKKDEFEIVKSRKDNFYHQKSQQGIFTRLSHPYHCDLESYLISRDLANHLERYEINGQAMGKALCDFELMNITFSSLFPDLHGAAMQANHISGWSFMSHE